MKIAGFHSSHRSLLTTISEGIVRFCILTTAVSAGVWLGIRPHGLNGRSAWPARRGQAVRMRRLVCGGIRAFADSYLPPGYRLAGFTRIGEDCFAMLEADEPITSPLGLGSGVADMFGADGRLTLRFSVIRRPDGHWEEVEYRRLPAAGASWPDAQRSNTWRTAP